MPEQQDNLQRVEQSGKFETRLLERLQTLTPKFLAIRQKMGIGENVGFAMLPDAHGVFSLGRLVDAQQEGERTFYNNTVDFLSGGGKVSADPEYVIVKPGDTPDSSMVSLFQRKGWREKGAIEERILIAPDEVLEGVIAHEFAHVIERWAEQPDEASGRVPESVKSFLLQEEADYQTDYKNAFESGAIFLPDNGSGRFEGNIDVIAALMGYKQQVLAKLEYMISCLLTYQDAHDTRPGGFKSAGRAIEESRKRIAKVDKYVS